MKDNDLLRLLKKNGWTAARITGSRHALQKGERTTVAPVCGRDVPTGPLNQILKETGLNFSKVLQDALIAKIQV